LPEKNPLAAAPQPVKGVSFGERMRRERELRGVKLEEIAESTKIGKRNLEALEAEAFDQLPGGIFNKGFVRAYAKFLGLDEEQAVTDFLAASANYDQPAALSPLASMVKPAVMPSDEAVRKKDLRWAIAALITLVVLGVWFYVSRSGSRKPRANAADSAPSATAANEAKPNPSAVAPTSTGNAASPSDGDKKSTAQPPNTPPSSQGSNTATSVPAQTQSSAATVVSVPGPLILSVHATADSWISVTGDGAPMGNFQMHAGETHGFQAEKELVLKAGNAGAIEATLNGKPLPKLGKDKEVKTATFTASGR
jgi:cytoskeleton protein RodZ